MEGKVEAELERLVEENILRAISFNSNWGAPIVPVLKADGGICISEIYK